MRALAIAAVALAAGCGSTHGPRSSASGRTLFAQQCSGCHTLTGRERGAPGGDLVLARLGKKDLVSFARVMPTKRRLTVAEARAVAGYIVSVTSGLSAARTR